MNPDLSVGLNHGWDIAQVFHKPFPLDNSCHDFEKIDEGRTLVIQLWICMAVDIIYLLSRYVFSLYFVSLTEYKGREMKNPCGYVLQKNSCLYIYLQIQLFGLYFIPWLQITGQIFSKIWICMVGEVIYIFYSYAFGLYFGSLTSMATEHDKGCYKKYSVCLICYFWIHISLLGELY